MGKWKVNIIFCNFASKQQKERAYRTWVRLWLKAKQKEITLDKPVELYYKNIRHNR
jgi:hypothetical protein